MNLSVGSRDYCTFTLSDGRKFVFKFQDLRDAKKDGCPQNFECFNDLNGRQIEFVLSGFEEVERSFLKLSEGFKKLKKAY